ncbi:hypothetical protein QHH03_30200, partial [Aphanizomenon sp. 202]|nr:hypothetical protein [Aphanizomenon sp. 202]
TLLSLFYHSNKSFMKKYAQINSVARIMQQAAEDSRVAFVYGQHLHGLVHLVAHSSLDGQAHPDAHFSQGAHLQLAHLQSFAQPPSAQTHFSLQHGSGIL